jgi:hypothetical protein
MVHIDDDHTPVAFKDEDKYEGKGLDANIAAGKHFRHSPDLSAVYVHARIRSFTKGRRSSMGPQHGATHWSISTKFDHNTQRAT